MNKGGSFIPGGGGAVLYRYIIAPGGRSIPVHYCPPPPAALYRYNIDPPPPPQELGEAVLYRYTGAGFCQPNLLLVTHQRTGMSICLTDSHTLKLKERSKKGVNICRGENLLLNRCRDIFVPYIYISVFNNEEIDFIMHSLCTEWVLHFYFLFVIVIIYSMYLYIAYEIKDDDDYV